MTAPIARGEPPAQRDELCTPGCGASLPEGTVGDPPPRPSLPAATPRRAIVGALLALQLLVLVGFGVVQFHRYALSYDDAAYTQAWWLIAHGRLDPLSTVIGIRFLANDGELLIWLLAPLAWVVPSSLTLIAVQALALVATNAVALAWIFEILAQAHRAHPPEAPASPAGTQFLWGLALAGVFLDPWCYVAAASPFHLEPFSALFAVLAARALSSGRSGLVPLWSVLLVATGFVGGLALLGIGLGELGARRGRGWAGWLLLGLGLGWLATLLEFHLAGAGGLVTRGDLAYLLPPGHHAGLAQLALAALEHPTKVVATVAPRLPLVLVLLLPLGVIGILTPRAAGLALTTWGVPLLLTGPITRLVEAFQFWPAVPLILVGTVVMVTSGRLLTGRLPAVILSSSAVTGAVLLVEATTLLIPVWLGVSPRQADLLRADRAATPRRAEVVTVNAVAGRFADRPSLFVLTTPQRTVPVGARPIVFVLAPSVAPLDVAPVEVRNFALAVARLRGVQVLPSGDGVLAFLWNPAPDTAGIVFPSGVLVRR
jgi:hypothetical protein